MWKFIREQWGRAVTLALVVTSYIVAPSPTRWVLIIGLTMILIIETGFGVNKKDGSDEPPNLPPGKDT